MLLNYQVFEGSTGKNPVLSRQRPFCDKICTDVSRSSGSERTGTSLVAGGCLELTGRNVTPFFLRSSLAQRPKGHRLWEQGA